MYINLKAKTEYSICKSAFTTGLLVATAKKYSMNSLAICDDGNLFGALEFAGEAVKNGIKPIIACEVKVIGYDGTASFFVKNEDGFKNLLNITSKSLCRAENHGIVSMEDIAQHCNGLIATSADISVLKYLSPLFKDNLYVEISRYTNEESEINREDILIKYAIEQNVPLVATNASYFASRDLFEATDALLCIGQGRYVDEEDRQTFSHNHYFKTPDEIHKLFSDIPEALENTINLAMRCNFYPTGSKPMLPSFASDENEELKRYSIAGLTKKLDDFGVSHKFLKEDYERRLEFELDVISKMGFAGYFLIVSDFIKWSKGNDVPVGPGRGSGAGSLVAYSLDITDLDPLKYGLIFERFLNPERVSMPDFDIDFCQENRYKVMEYVKNKYGSERVAAIITFGKLQARAVLKDVGRVLQMNYKMVDDICKLVPFNPVDPVTLNQALEMDKKLQEQREDDETTEKLIDIGLKLEGLIRHTSTHAAGIIIADKPLINIVPLSQNDGDELPAVGYGMKMAEKAGLVKFDFLGLKTLTLIKKALDLVRKNHGIDMQPNRIPLQDDKTFKLLQSGFSRGIFQLDGSICRDSMRQMKIDTFEDIIALTSLNRPGPMENLPSFILRKLGKEKIEYPHAILESILKETYGIIIYQEQVIQIAQTLAFYTAGEADLLRRAMGKKIKEEMDAQSEKFKSGAIKNGISEAKAKEVFALVEKFAGYGFNKSHAAAYSVLSFQTAYIKANYPLEFFTACLNMDIGDSDNINLFIMEAKKMGIVVEAPDVNRSCADFTISDGKIIYALAGLKGVGMASMKDLEEIRKAGDFVDIFDFCKRCGNKVANKKQIEAFAKSGTFDQIAQNRNEIVSSLEALVAYSGTSDGETNSLFGDEEISSKPRLSSVKEFSQQEKLINEFEAFGFYMSGHPLEAYIEKLSGFVSSENLEDIIGEKEIHIKMAGVVSIVKQRSGKRGRFAFVYFSDLGGIYEAAIFKDDVIAENRDTLIQGKVVAISASVSRHESGNARIIVNDLADISNLAKIAKFHTGIKERPKWQNKKDEKIEIQSNEFFLMSRINLTLKNAINIEKIKDIIHASDTTGGTSIFIILCGKKILIGSHFKLKLEDVKLLKTFGDVDF